MTVFRPGGLELTKKALDILGFIPGSKALDIGCGLGATLAFLSENYSARVFGVDCAAEAVKKAGERLGADKLYCADARKLPFEAGSFQLVLMECVLTLIPQPEKALSEAVRVLAPGGNLVISGLTGASSGPICQQGRMDISALQTELEALGMELLHLSDETALLRRFVAEVIFDYDSLEQYIAHADKELGGSVLSCNVPMKGTGYALIIARKL